MKDFNGKELNIGDKVITTVSNGRSGSYAGYAKGIVIGFTPKMIKIELIKRPDCITPKPITKEPYTVVKYEWE